MSHFTDAFMQIESTDTLVWREYEPRIPLSPTRRVASETDLYAEIHRTGEAHGGLFVIHYANGAVVTFSYPRGIRHVDGRLPTWRVPDDAVARQIVAERAVLPVQLPHVELVAVAP